MASTPFSDDLNLKRHVVLFKAKNHRGEVEFMVEWRFTSMTFTQEAGVGVETKHSILACVILYKHDVCW